MIILACENDPGLQHIFNVKEGYLYGGKYGHASIARLKNCVLRVKSFPQPPLTTAHRFLFKLGAMLGTAELQLFICSLLNHKRSMELVPYSHGNETALIAPPSRVQLALSKQMRKNAKKFDTLAIFY